MRLGAGAKVSPQKYHFCEIGVRRQTKVDFFLRSISCLCECIISFFLYNLWLFLFYKSSIFFVLRVPF
jgi:hypothetical protein